MEKRKLGFLNQTKKLSYHSDWPYGNNEEFGKAVAFLLSPTASYITGVSLAVDGGIMKTVW